MVERSCFIARCRAATAPVREVVVQDGHTSDYADETEVGDRGNEPLPPERRSDGDHPEEQQWRRTADQVQRDHRQISTVVAVVVHDSVALQVGFQYFSNC